MGPAMTPTPDPTPDPTTIPSPTPDHEGPVDPRPAWERVAYTWLAREVDAGQPVDPTELAREVSVAPDLARDLLRLLRAQRTRDPGLAELRARLVRDRITDAYLRRELHGDQHLDPAALAVEVGTTTTIARQWLTSLRYQQRADGGVLVEPVSHGHPTPEQLAGLQAHFASGGHQQAAVTGRPADPERLAATVERHYWTREVRAGQRLRPSLLARELGGDPRQISQQLAELRAGPSTAGERIAQLWNAHQQDPAARPLHSSRLAWRLGVSDSYVQHRTWQLRTRSGQAPLGERLAATRQQLASPPPVEHTNGEWDWRLDAACAEVDPELFFPETGQVPQAAAAKQVCAGCVVRGPCLEAALHGPPGPRRSHRHLRWHHRPPARRAARPPLVRRGDPVRPRPGGGRGSAGAGEREEHRPGRPRAGRLQAGAAARVRPSRAAAARRVPGRPDPYSLVPGS
jgi:hypothetical protein